MKSIAITGGAGFIGSHLVDALIKENYSIVVIDNYSTGSPQNLSHHLRNKNLKLVEGDIRDVRILREARQCEVIIHLAALKIPRYGNSLDTLMVNALGTMNVLELAKQTRARVIFASTSDCFGTNTQLPFNEESASVLGPSSVPRWAYAVSKLFGEHLCFSYLREQEIETTVIRYFGGYGPRHHKSWWGGPQAVFIESLLNGQPMEIHGDGSQTRCFAYVSDMIEGTLQVLKREGLAGELFNIGGNEEISILDLARKVQTLVGIEGSLRARFLPYEKISNHRYQDVSRRVPDLKKAERLLGFTPRVSLEEGLKKTIAWHHIGQSSIPHLQKTSPGLPHWTEIH